MALKHTQPDFAGQLVYVGIDVGKTNWRVCIMTDLLEHRTFAQPPTTEALVSYLHRSFPHATYRCVYEAGYSGFWIAEQLQHQGIDCLIVNPGDVPTTNRERAFKTDRIDARKLARALHDGAITDIHHPSHETQEDRSLMRTRLQLVKEQTRCKNRIKSFLAFYGIVLDESLIRTHWSQRYIAQLTALSLAKTSGTVAFQTLLGQLQSLRGALATVTKQIRALANEPRYRVRVDCLTSIPGIGVLSAMIFLTEIEDIHRFRSLDHLACYVGLVPGEHSSGDDQITTGITRRRNPHLRMVLVESAWITVKKDPALLLAFETLAKRMPKNQAIIRITRKLLNRMRYVLLHQEVYVPGVAA